MNAKEGCNLDAYESGSVCRVDVDEKMHCTVVAGAMGKAVAYRWLIYI